MQLVSLNRTYVLRSVLLALLLLWPLLTFGKPAYMVDSAAYQQGGEKAVSFVIGKLERLAGSPAQKPPIPAAKADDDDGTKVARSIIYSVLGYIFGGPGLTMAYLVAFQALCAALAITALFEAVAGSSWRGFATMAGVLTFATSLAPTVAFVVPDCFAGIMLAIMMVLPFYWRRFSWPVLLLLLALAVFSVAVHASHPPVALGTALVAALWIVLLRKGGPGKGSLPVLPMLLLWAPAVLGLMLVMLTGLVGFGKASVAPKHHPLALARGIDNGPVRWYLQQACSDRTRYAICEIYGTNIPETVQQLLWSKDNLIRRATPDQLDRVRAEENTILLRATLNYPLQQAYFVLHDVPQQFFSFRINHLRYGGSIGRNEQGVVILKNPGTGEAPSLLDALNILANIVVIIATGLLAWWWRGMTVAQRGVLLTLVTGLLANAAVCAIFSGVAPRYQARLIWLVPFAAIAIGFARGGWKARSVEPSGQVAPA